MKRTCFLSMLLATALTTACSGGDAEHNRAANQPATPAAGGAGGAAADAAREATSADRDFVREIASGNMAEVQMAELALQRASDNNVKKFAQMMVTDHTQAGEKLKALASQHNLVTTGGDAEKNPAEAFADKRGADFEREYADTMVDAHQDMVDKLESRIDKENLTKWKESTTNPATGEKAKGEAMTFVAEKSDNPVTLALNQWAAQTYPVAFAHLQAAKDLQKGLQGRGTTTR